MKDRSGFAVGLTAWLVLVCAWVSWAPFIPAPPEEPGFAVWSGHRDAWYHTLLLIPLALVVTFSLHRRGCTMPFFKSFLGVAGFGALLEGGQWWVAFRTVTLDDLLANTAGVAAGVLAAGCLLKTRVPEYKVLFSTGLVVALTLGIGVVKNVVKYGADFRVADWNSEYAIVVGDEADGTRPYLGEIREAVICAGEGRERVCIGPGREYGLREELIRIAERSQKVQVSAKVRSASDDQKGPARIMTFSQDAFGRNLTLAQEGKNLVFRIRTPLTGSNGADIAFVLPGVVSKGRETLVSAEYDKGTVVLRSQTEGTIACGKFRPDLLKSSLQLDGTKGKTVAKVLQGPGGTVAFLLGLTGLGGLVGLLARRLRWALLLAAGSGVVAVWALNFVLLKTSLGLYEVFLTVGASVFGSALSAIDLERIRSRAGLVPDWSSRTRQPEDHCRIHLRPLE